MCLPFSEYMPRGSYDSDDLGFKSNLILTEICMLSMNNSASWPRMTFNPVHHQFYSPFQFKICFAIVNVSRDMVQHNIFTYQTWWYLLWRRKEFHISNLYKRPCCQENILILMLVRCDYFVIKDAGKPGLVSMPSIYIYVCVCMIYHTWH